MIKSHRNSMIMDAVATIIKNTVISLMYYAGNIWLNQQANIDPVRTEYHKCIKLLSLNIPRLSFEPLMNFMGFPCFESIHDYMNAEMFCKVLPVTGTC